MLVWQHIYCNRVNSFTLFLIFWEGRKLVKKALNSSWIPHWICKAAAPSIEQQRWKKGLKKDINHFGQPTNQRNPNCCPFSQIIFHIFNIMTLPVHQLGSSSDRWCNDALFLWTAVCGDCSHQREVDLHSNHAHVPWIKYQIYISNIDDV